MLDNLPFDRRLRLGLEGLGHPHATEVQNVVVPAALRGADLLVSAETGSGKTLCYLIPIAQRILEKNEEATSGTLALILVPTRELARQVVRHARHLLQKSHIKVQGITGGADTRYQKSLLRKDPEIVVATPGRLRDLCNQGATALEGLQTLVLDEADRMLDMGLRDDVVAIAGRCNPQRQTLMLSATLKHQGVEAVARDLLNDAQHISIGEVRQAHSAIFHQMILADGREHKDKLLPALLDQGDFAKALVFANKRLTADRLASLLLHHGLRCASLHGEMSTEARKKVVERFQQGKIDVLCASDVAARGLDVADIDLVVNYDVPHSGDDYLHRTGRTGRAGRQGMAVSLVSAAEWNLSISIQRYLNLTFERRTLAGLKARFNGPKKLKSSGKAAGPKKKKKAGSATEKARSRKRNQKNVGKPKKSSRKGVDKPAAENDGFAPLTRKKPGSQ
ncbi:MAG: DEAD/DEAH box helicase [Halioglobus sp.]